MVFTLLGHAVSGDPDDPDVLVGLQAPDGDIVWVGRRRPGAGTFIADEGAPMTRVDRETAVRILCSERWPDVGGDAEEGLRSARATARAELQRRRTTEDA